MQITVAIQGRAFNKENPWSKFHQPPRWNYEWNTRMALLERRWRVKFNPRLRMIPIEGIVFGKDGSTRCTALNTFLATTRFRDHPSKMHAYIDPLARLKLLPVLFQLAAYLSRQLNISLAHRFLGYRSRGQERRVKNRCKPRKKKRYSVIDKR